MASSIQQILAAQNLIGRIQDVVGGVPEDLLPPGFMSSTRKVEGDRGEYLRVEGTRETARTNRYGAPARKREPVGLKETPVKLLHTFEEFSHDPTTLNLLMSESGNGGDFRQQMGRETIQRQVDTFGQLFRNLRISAVYSALSLGAVYFDADGNLLPTASGTKHTIDFGVPAANKTTLNVFGAGALLSNWLYNSSTNPKPGIMTQIKKVKSAARKLTGYPLKYAFYGENIPKHLLEDPEVANLIHGSNKLAEQVASVEIPEICGLTWIPADQAFFVDQAGVVKSWFGAEQITFTPDISSEWWEFLEGTYPVPRNINLAGDLTAALGNFEQATGAFSFANITVNPPSIQHFAGDTFLPVLKNPQAVFIATVPVT